MFADASPADDYWKHCDLREIVHFQLFTVIKTSFIERFCAFAEMFLKLSDANVLYVGKGYTHRTIDVITLDEIRAAIWYLTADS